ncbi:glycerophosphodiester phosphodiesterase family protein [Kiloniella laminariae]|uniref:Glycerophosphodiester phosphodiesterase family protein n=1 Tax=Kiloniella laminariae TaxID=454162 RepID=A0ABT4LJN6_9PROT|nr:glycerophosphodiester phosphodiesterase family protein [Kiloniella laminariae]MCZ4281320.1 glycerophosphodiester phosphodiesterase family protein [Kiloniella laminariae]
MANATPVVTLPRVQAHRGASGVRPENTMTSFREALAQGASWTEFDVKLSKDGVPLLYHDKDLKRTSGREGLIKDFTFAELQDFEAGAWFGAEYAGEKIPSFEEVMQFHIDNGMQANIEFKPSDGEEDETVKAVVEMLERIWPKDRPKPLFSSFKHRCLEVARDIAPAYPRGLLTYDELDNWKADAERLVCAAIHPWHKTLTPDLVKAFKQAGYGIATYTVNDPVRARELVAMGVDSIITDHPAVMIDALS